MEAFETFLPSSTRISCSLPSSLDFPKAPLGRPSSFPWAFAAASPSLVRSEIRSPSTGEQSEQDPLLDRDEADIAMDQSVHDLDHLREAASQTRQLADQQAIAHLKSSQHLVYAALERTLSRRDAGLDEFVDREAAFLAELQDGQFLVGEIL